MGIKKASSPLMSPLEFDALPLSVRRKYFSSLERLRIADHQQHDPREPSISASRPSRPGTSAVAPIRSLALGRNTRRRLRKAESVRQEHDLCQAEALFFLSLPAKLRKQHFSREEQVVLAGRCDQQATTHDPDCYRASQRFNTFDLDFYDDASDASIEAPRGRSRRRSFSPSPAPSPTRRGEADVEPDPAESLIHLDTMSPPVSRPAAPPTAPFRRTMSLTSMPFRYSTSSAPPLASPPLFALGPQPWRQRAASQSTLPGRRSSLTPVAPVFDPEATHYQDPEARKKLRTYLSSPQKFDEAVEFGFPSTAGNDTVTPSYRLPHIATDARHFSRDLQTFLRDDKVSFLETDDGASSASDGDSETDIDSPITPSSTGLTFPGHTRQVSSSNFSSLDATGFLPTPLMPGRLNRDMTLRMTLTRPDLRAEEDLLYGWQGQRVSRDDPFALEELHLSDDMTGAKGAFAVKPKPSGNLVTRLFKRASKRGRC